MKKTFGIQSVSNFRHSRLPLSVHACYLELTILCQESRNKRKSKDPKVEKKREQRLSETIETDDNDEYYIRVYA